MRFLTLALLEAEDGGTIRAARGDVEALDMFALLEDLGLLEPAPYGWVPSARLRAQRWVAQLRDDPMMVYD